MPHSDQELVPSGGAAAAPAQPGAGHGEVRGHSGFWGLTLGSIGVVYGDIGTSPLYALREALLHATPGGFSRDEVLGVVSLLFWALIVVVTLKYIFFLMQADNRGEGGTLSLMALAQSAIGRHGWIVFLLGVTGASLFYGDAMITPAISVLSAVEGLKLVTPVFEPYILPITIVILGAVFAVQSSGTQRVAAFFGPITAVWFLVMALLGLSHIGDDPGVLLAASPHYAVRFLVEHGSIGFVVLGSVFLAVTGAEALYADMGHFGRRPIRMAWLAFVFPALSLNYFGQGALILQTPAALENPFYLLAPSWALLPLVLLATVATVIACQAVITGAFSITQQAIQLGVLPRLEIRHTSETQFGQIYMPQVNTLLFLGVLLLVLLFETSGNLASAYGIAVTGEMVMGTLLAFVVVRKVWGWSLPSSLLVTGAFLSIDLIFFSANLLKFFDGGYVPLAFAAAMILAMWTWRRGTSLVARKIERESLPLADLIKMLAKSPPQRVKNTAVFLTSTPDIAPSALMHNLKHNQVLHERNIIMTIRTADMPRVPEAERITIEPLSNDFTKLTLSYGFMEKPNVPRALGVCRRLGLKLDIMKTSFFLGRRSIKASAQSGMPLWQDRLYIALTKQATDATDYFAIPSGRVVELGAQITV